MNLSLKKTTRPRPSPERAFGIVIRRLRTERGWSQEDLALESGVCSRNYLGLLESGEHSPSLYIVYGLAHALKISVPDLLARVDLLVNGKPSRRNKY